MNNSNNKIIKSYIKAVTNELKCSKMLSSVFRERFIDEIYNFAEVQDDISYEILSMRFGTPKEIADGFLERADYEELLKLSKKKEVFWRWVAIIGVIFLVIVVGLFIGYIDTASGKINVTGPIIE